MKAGNGTIATGDQQACLAHPGAASAYGELDLSGRLTAVPRQYAGGLSSPFLVGVYGDCMQPCGIDDGDAVVADYGAAWSDGDVVVARSGAGYVVKRAYRYCQAHAMLIADAPGYMALLVKSTDVLAKVACVKKVSGRFRKLLMGPTRDQVKQSLSYWRLDTATNRFVRMCGNENGEPILL